MYLMVQILMGKFPRMKKISVVLCATLVSFVSSAVTAKLQGNNWLESVEGGLVTPFVFLVVDLSACSLQKACNSSGSDEKKLTTEFNAAMTKLRAFTNKFSKKAKAAHGN